MISAREILLRIYAGWAAQAACPCNINKIEYSFNIRLLTAVKSVNIFRKAHKLGLVGFAGCVGATCWTRTNDPAVNSRMLYRLS